jgi:hypothetical protein
MNNAKGNVDDKQADKIKSKPKKQRLKAAK